MSDLSSRCPFVFTKREDRIPKVRAILARPYGVFPPHSMLELMDVLMSYKKDWYLFRRGRYDSYRPMPRSVKISSKKEIQEHQKMLEDYVKSHLPKKRVPPLVSFRPHKEDFLTNLGCHLAEGALIELHRRRMGAFVHAHGAVGYIIRVTGSTIRIASGSIVFEAVPHDVQFGRRFDKEGCILAAQQRMEPKTQIRYFSMSYFQSRDRLLSPTDRLPKKQLDLYNELFQTNAVSGDPYTEWALSLEHKFLGFCAEIVDDYEAIKQSVPETLTYRQ